MPKGRWWSARRATRWGDPAPLASGLAILVTACSLGPPPPPNEQPTVIPSLREWSGGVGEFTISADSRIIVDPGFATELTPGARAFSDDLELITGQRLPVLPGEDPDPGDFLLTLATSDSVIGREGYLLEADRILTLRATTPEGVMHGTRTALQLLKQDSSRTSVPRGTARDYPKWEIRGFMLDVGRMYYPFATLRDYVKFMAYYKMNEFHLHLNDNMIRPENFDDPSGFRLESDVFPGLATAGEAYTKAEWADLEALAAIYGVTILPEIDTPAHSLAFTRYRPELRHPEMDVDHIDLSRSATTAFMDSVFNEFLPVFSGPEVHIGTDEYNGGDAADFRSYVNRLNALVKSHGKTARMWGSQATQGGAAGFDRDIRVDIWYNGYYDPVQAIEDGYQVVNIRDALVYIVPTAGYYHDYLPTESLYDTWEPWVFGGGSDLDPDEPGLLGGKFAVWNDKLGEGYNVHDVYDRVRPAAQTLSEKLWSGATGVPYETFVQSWEAIGDAPGTGLAGVGLEGRGGGPGGG